MRNFVENLYLSKLFIMEKKYNYIILFPSAIVIAILLTFVYAFSASDNDSSLYHLDMSSASTYTTTCADGVKANRWELKEHNCQLTTSNIILPGSSSKDPNLDVPVSFTISTNGTPIAGDYVKFEYYVSSWVKLDSLGYSSLPSSKTAYTYGALNIPAGSTIKFRVSFNITGAKALSKLVLWASSSTETSAGTPYITGTMTKFTVSLPVKLLSFDAKIVSNEALVSWKTASEINNSHFIVEKSINGLSFLDVGRVNGSGNSNSEKEYSIKDKDLQPGTTYYRLKQVDYDGKYEYFDIVALNNDGENTSECKISVNPNPCIGRCSISLDGCKEDVVKNLSFYLFDFLGNSVKTELPTGSDGSTALTFDVNNNLKPGVYILKGVAFSKHYDKKVIIQK